MPSPKKIILACKKGLRLMGSPEFGRVQQLNAEEESKRPERSEIINFILSKMQGPTRYLEIGVRNPSHNFNKIQATEKYSVDPGLEFKSNPVDFPHTSDTFFSLMDKGEILPGLQFDLIFIDGLHLAEQVDRDIANALRHLKDSGFILLHDCNPPSEWHARECYEFYYTPAEGAWNGTTWKAFLKWRSQPGLSSCCLDSDWGVGVITRHIELGPKPSLANEFYEFTTFQQNRKDLLNLMDFEEFKSVIERGYRG